MKKIILALSILALASCKKDSAEPETPAGGTSSMPFAKIKKTSNGNPDFQWTYTGETKLSSMKWEDFPGGTAALVADISSISYNGDLLSKIEASPAGGNKTTYNVIYSGGKFQKVTSSNTANTNVWNFEVEYDASGKIVQFNRYRTSGGAINASSVYSLTYDASGNVTAVKFQQGTLTTNYVLKYDTKENKAYSHADLRAISIGEISYHMNHFWGLPFLLTLNKNNVVEMTTTGTSEKHIYSYEFDASQNIKKVTDDWTLASGSKIVSEWVITK